MYHYYSNKRNYAIKNKSMPKSMGRVALSNKQTPFPNPLSFLFSLHSKAAFIKDL